MSDFPPRVEKLRALLQTTLKDDDFSIEEIWVTKTTFADEVIARRHWRVTIQAGPNAIPSVVDIPDKLVIESLKSASAMVVLSPKRIIRRKI